LSAKEQGLNLLGLTCSVKTGCMQLLLLFPGLHAPLTFSAEEPPICRSSSGSQGQDQGPTSVGSSL